MSRVGRGHDHLSRLILFRRKTLNSSRQPRLIYDESASLTVILSTQSRMDEKSGCSSSTLPRPRRISFERALLKETFRRFGSARNEVTASERASDKIMTSRSPPWKRSTVSTDRDCKLPRLLFKRRLRMRACWAL